MKSTENVRLAEEGELPPVAVKLNIWHKVKLSSQTAVIQWRNCSQFRYFSTSWVSLRPWPFACWSAYPTSWQQTPSERRWCTSKRSRIASATASTISADQYRAHTQIQLKYFYLLKLTIRANKAPTTRDKAKRISDPCTN